MNTRRLAHLRQFRAALGGGLLIGYTLLAPAAEPALLPGASRVLFLGDSITYSGQYIESIEAYFVTRFPHRVIQFLNLGLPSETVSGLSEEGHAGGKFPRPDLHERLARVLKKTAPDTVIACYGMNDGIYLPYAEERFGKFRDGLRWLRDIVTNAGAKLILVTPPTFDEVKGGHAGYADTLDRYASWMLAQRAAGWDVADVHGPMNRFLAERRQSDPGFFLAGDGVHPGEVGQWIIARQLLLHLGATDLANVTNAQRMVETHLLGPALLKLIQQKQRLLKDAWLTETGHERPGMNKGLPLAQARMEAAKLDHQIQQLAITNNEEASGPPADTRTRPAALRPGPTDASGRPLIRKLGTVDLDMVETTPVVFRGRLWRCEWVRQGTGQQYWNNQRHTNYFRLRNPATGEVTPPFADGHEFGSAFVDGETLYVTGTQGRSRVDLFVSRDLRTWETRPVINDGRYGIFNTSLWRTPEGYVLAFEIDKPSEEAGVPFTIRFARSADLKTWAITPPECNFTKERYSAAPGLRWHDGWFYLFYLEAHQGYETRVVRSRDLVHWTASPLNPVLRASPDDKQIANAQLTPEQRTEIAAAKNINNSDLDFCEWQGRLVINYSWGNQEGTEFLATAEYDGTLAQFLRGWFPEAKTAHSP